MRKTIDDARARELGIVFTGLNVTHAEWPSLVVDRKGTVYGFTKEQPPQAPQGQPAAKARLFMFKSTDGGASWTTDVISVAPDGRIDVAWYDFRNDPFFRPGETGNMGSAVGERYWDVYYSYSTDGGASWAPNLRVTSPSLDGDVGITFNNYDVRGPLGVASTDTAAYLAWPDPRPTSSTDVQAEDAYFSRVRFEQTAPLGTDAGRTPGWQWALLGAAAALVVGGLVLGAGVHNAREEAAAP